jgi:Family of unknown function (DUF6261)
LFFNHLKNKKKMKTLHPVNLARLSVLEFGQHIKSVNENVNLLGKGFITDSALANYLQGLQTNMVDYDKAVLQITKSDETAKIVAADRRRDNSLTALSRLLSVYELSESESELAAHASLNTLFTTYKGIQKWNFEEESNGIDNLLADLDSDKYKPLATALNMTAYIDRLKSSNDNFKTLFANRTQEVSAKETYNITAMRREIKRIYDDMASYTLSLAKAQEGNEMYSKTLDILNTVRKYYHDLLAKRTGGTKDDPETPIPPMA